MGFLEKLFGKSKETRENEALEAELEKEIKIEETYEFIEEEVRYICRGTVVLSDTMYGKVEYSDPTGKSMVLETKDISANELNEFEGKSVNLYVNQLDFNDVTYTNMLNILKCQELKPHKYTGEMDMYLWTIENFDDKLEGIIEPFNGECYSILFTEQGYDRRISVIPQDNKFIDEDFIGNKISVAKTKKGQYVYISDELLMM